MGAGSPQTVARNVYDVQLAIDRAIIKEKIAEKADVIHLQVDSRTFGEHSMQAVLITLLYISWDEEKDALETRLYSVSKILVPQRPSMQRQESSRPAPSRKQQMLQKGGIL